jgi:hypothetical protein
MKMCVRGGISPKNLNSQGERPSDRQGDQIEPIFAFWAIVYFGTIFENYNTL